MNIHVFMVHECYALRASVRLTSIPTMGDGRQQKQHSTHSREHALESTGQGSAWILMNPRSQSSHV